MNLVETKHVLVAIVSKFLLKKQNIGRLDLMLRGKKYMYMYNNMTKIIHLDIEIR